MRDLNIGVVTPQDGRRIEVIANGLPLFHGAQLAVDVTMRHPRTREGDPSGQADWKDGAVAEAARADKESTYPEFSHGHRCQLVVLAVETGGRFSRETCDFLRDLAWARAETAPRYLRGSTARAMEARGPRSFL